MKTWTSLSGLLLTPWVDDVIDFWALSLLSSVADHFETLELGVWRIREGNACVSLEISLLVRELARPVTFRGIVLASCPCRGLQYVMCLLLKHLHSWRKQHPSSYSGVFFICVAPSGDSV